MDHTPVNCDACFCSRHLSLLLQLSMACFGWLLSFPSLVIWRTNMSWYTLRFFPLFSPVFYHTSAMNFISYLHGILCLSPVLCSAFGFSLGMKTLRKQFCSSLLLFLQPTSAVWKATTLIACNGIPKYQ